MAPNTADEAIYDAFRFTVEVRAQTVAGFAEVSGLTQDAGFLSWRWGEEIIGNIRKLVGLRKYTNITLKRGYTESSTLWDWWRETRQAVADDVTRDLVVVLRDERGRPVRTWHLTKARCRSFVSPLDPKAESMAIERMDIACEDVRRRCRRD